MKGLSLVFLIFLAVQCAAIYEFSYFDDLRKTRNSSASLSISNPKMLWTALDDDGQSFNLGLFSIFMPFTDGSSFRDASQDEITAIIMAIYHFNNPELSPHLDPLILSDCSIKFTSNFYDTKYSPINTTRLFTKILQEPNEFQNPHPAGVIGAYRSAVTSPLAILTGVNGIPQVSFASTSTDFDVKDQYPLFGRTIPSSVGEATMLLGLFQAFHASHIGVLFVTDAFGSALQKAFQDAASEESIVTDSVAFSYSADLDGDEIPNAVESLKKTEYRVFLVVAFELHYEAIMTAAYHLGLIGPNFFWLFFGLDPVSLQQLTKYPPDSPLAKATSGIGVVSSSGGLRPEILYSNIENIPKVSKDSDNSYEKFRFLWRTTVEDPKFIAYVQSHLPTTLSNTIGFIPKVKPNKESTGYSTFAYDAITALGWSYCLAANTTNNAEFDGSNVFSNFSNLDFNGASGKVKVIPETGTRNITSVHYILSNFQIQEIDQDGNQIYKIVPVRYYNNVWEVIEGRDFVFAEGSTRIPESLPPPNVQMNYIGSIGRYVGYTLMGIVVVSSLVAFIWLFYFRKERVIRSSQPLFLYMIALGSLVMVSSIIPLSLEEPVADRDLDAACMVAPWLYISGAVLVFSALLAKIRVVRHAYLNPSIEIIHVTVVDIIRTFFIIFSLNFIVLITWQSVSPLKWNRVDREATDVFDRPVDSYGICSSDGALPFGIVTIVMNILVLMFSNWWAYKSRNIETEYNENRYIGISMASMLQAWCMGIPILIVVWDNPQAKFFVETGIIFVTASAVLLLIFIPKILAIRTDRIKAAEENKRIAYTSFTSRVRKKDDMEDDEKVGPLDESLAKEPLASLESNDESHPVWSTISETGERVSSVDMLEKDEVTSGGQVNSISVNVDDLKTQSISPPITRGGLRNSHIIESITKTIRFSVLSSFNSGESSAPFEGLEGLRVTHNPRAPQNLKMSGGLECSRAQLENLEQASPDIEEDK